MVKGPALVLAPHTDDGELGCGATIAKLVEEGIDVHYLAFSGCEESVPDGFPKDVLRHEVLAATNELGVPAGNVSVLHYPVRHFLTHRQEILEDLVRLSRELAPGTVFAPSSFDVHQDHNVVFQEARRAFKNMSILGYEFMWNNFAFNSSLLSVVSESHIAKKVAAIRQYKSQSHRAYGQDDLIRGQAKFRGLQIHQEYAEAFEVIRWII